jgi:phosphoribosylanthranilate isomerase
LKKRILEVLEAGLEAMVQLHGNKAGDWSDDIEKAVELIKDIKKGKDTTPSPKL